MEKAFIGVDFDGTLATYDRYVGPSVVGEPIVKMVEKVKRRLKKKRLVKIFTARVHPSHTVEDIAAAREAITAWCVEHIGQALEIICDKHPKMYEIWDDKAVAVQKNTGECLRW